MAGSKGRIENPTLRAIVQELLIPPVVVVPLTADDDWFKASTALAASSEGVSTTTVTSFTNAACPGIPYVPVATITPQGSTDDWTSVTVRFQGRDQFGDIYDETITATGSSGARTATATHAVRSLSRVTITVAGTVTTSATEKIGFVKTIGTMRRLRSSADLIRATFDGASDAGTLSVAKSTYVIAGTPNSAKVLTLLMAPTIYTT